MSVVMRMIGEGATRILRDDDGEIADIDRVAEDRLPTGVDPRQRQEVIDHRARLRDGRADLFERGTVFGAAPVAHQGEFGRRLDDAERRAQLVRGVGDERLLLRERPPHRHHHLPDEEETTDHRHEDDADADQGHDQAEFIEQGMERPVRPARSGRSRRCARCPPRRSRSARSGRAYRPQAMRACGHRSPPASASCKGSRAGKLATRCGFGAKSCVPSGMKR